MGRKQADHVYRQNEEQLRLALIDAHERERRRLSEELHDGVGQRLALLAAELALLREHPQNQKQSVFLPL